jgi:hypothetical protein
LRVKGATSGLNDLDIEEKSKDEISQNFVRGMMRIRLYGFESTLGVAMNGTNETANNQEGNEDHCAFRPANRRQQGDMRLAT